MFKIYQRLRWFYQKFKFSYSMPFLALISYTFIGATIFRTLELEHDQKRRDIFKNETEYAFNQVLDRMIEVRCEDVLLKHNRSEQIRHAKDAMYWFLDHMNLTAIIEERSDPSPWTWWGSLSYAGQLYTTIGYGFPSAKTRGGRLASIVYIMIGIPIFLLILKDVGRLMSRALRKFYKRMKKSKQKIAETKPIRRLSQPTKSFFKADKGDAATDLKDIKERKETVVDIDPVKENKLNEKERLRAEVTFPIPIALGMLLIWIMFSSALFCIWETEWGYLTSIYFFFVSISTVGLGDIVPSKPDMMIFNFILILVGLALLSMCFNLIQITLERFLDRLLEEYIEEIEKMAEIVNNDEGPAEQAIPFEFKMSTGGLLTVPFKKVGEHHGILGDIKSYVAERVAENLIASRLGVDSDSDSEESEEKPETDEKLEKDEKEQLVVESKQGSRRNSVARFIQPSKYQLMYQRPLLKTIQTIERIRPQKNDFRSVIFSKFVHSEKLSRLVEEVAPPPSEKNKKMVTISCQTDTEPKMRRLCGRKSRDSVSTVGTCDSFISTSHFKDIHFDYATDASHNDSALNLRSTLSILKIEDEEPILQSKLMQMKSPPLIRLAQGLRKPPRPLRHIPSSPCAFGTVSLTSRNSSPTHAPLCPSPSLPTGDLIRIQSICGLLPVDFDRYRAQSIDGAPSDESRSHGYRSQSSMEDSGIDRSHAMETSQNATHGISNGASEVRRKVDDLILKVDRNL